MLNDVTWSWKYKVGDLVCSPRGSTNEVWGSLIVMKCVVTATIKYYECWSQKASRMIDMPKRVLEENWYVPKEENKETA